MKALGVRQPWAWLIVQGHKEIEYRNWLTHYRGRFFVHANKAVDKEELSQARTRLAGDGIIIPDDLPRGGLIGIVTLVDCVRYDDVSRPRRFLGRFLGQQSPSFGFILQDPKPLPFKKYRGQQKFFNVPDDLYGLDFDI